MSIAASGSGQAEYLALVSVLPLRPIRSEAALSRAVKKIDALLDQDSLSRAQQDYLDVLSDLVQRYESDKHPVQPIPDAAMLRHLIEAKGVSQVAVSKATGIVNSTISEVLKGRRMLSRRHIGRLARYFNVPPTVFAALDEH